MNQSFNPNELLKMCRDREYDNYGFTEAEFQSLLNDTHNKILKGQFQFTIIKNRDSISLNQLDEKLVLRKINDNLKKIYKDIQSNRNVIISQIIRLLESTAPSYIIKTDIKDFYGSINRQRIIEKLENDSILSYHSLRLLRELFNNPSIKDAKGLPRGLNVSSTLSEIYMRKFDNWIRQYYGVFYYARYVDDIVIFVSNSESLCNLRNEISGKLSSLADGLKVNEEKTNEFDTTRITQAKPFEYLGYRFIKTTLGKNANVEISIASKKISKIKTRIILAFINFLNLKDYELLKDRIRFLTGNYTIRRRKEGNSLKAGLYYNYMWINDYSALEELNSFYFKALNSRNKSFGAKINSGLQIDQKKELSRFSFKHGFLYKTHRSFSYERVKQIIECWKWEK